eukprot:TRINITY_DN11537_c0_g1_i1.p1 TRINITY_DN11537_c0_g1~~TRINITY_DN11537_c0_g1_i1.p1  ORF type:complete len:236 (-),score=111.08 TRINITY_DN11537_c0_g1_i1:10-717(-)
MSSNVDVDRASSIGREEAVLRVFKSLTPKPKELLLSPRNFVREGKIKIRSGKTKKPRYLFLFNDVLLISKKETSLGSTKYWLRVYARLRSDLRFEEPQSSPNPDLEFLLVAPKKTYTMVAESPAAKKEWLQLFERCLAGEFDPTKQVIVREESSSSGPPSDAPPTPNKEIEEKIVRSHLEVYNFGGFDFTSLISGEEDKDFLEVIAAANADSLDEVPTSNGANSDDDEENEVDAD